ncbi:STM4015 family protein [Chitinophaga agri]|uniref:Molybdenum metabolism regulator n=1 Tax=Chitinophaga agri TaxID=2703787 RepID=A0A6B9ZP86_9BACT|nr:STM4015 family protein [Chitinophaga agri]QHS63451.1 molybdenum metabolism regulator [Chitinophaga agri]
MTVTSNLSEFQGKRVEIFNPETGIVNPETVVYRISTDYDEPADAFSNKVDAFANDPRAGEVKELIIGMFSADSSTDSSSVIQKLVEHHSKLPQLTHLFIGDMTYEECEISWIQQSDMHPLLSTYTGLEHFQVRGGEGLRFSNLAHANLKTLIVETGGLSTTTLEDILAADLPKLEKLVLWLGSENYGFDSTISNYAPIISGEKFPGLQYLGLMNSEIQDDIAAAVSAAPFTEKLHTLDLSMGALTDKGGEALLHSDHIRKLTFLNLRHHYLSNNMMAKLQGIGVEMNIDEQEAMDEYGPYIEVSE